MVQFTCDICAKVLKKSQVDKHWHSCHNDSVSCIECGKTLFGDDYKLHLTCDYGENAPQKEAHIIPPSSSSSSSDGTSLSGRVKRKESRRDRWQVSIQAAHAKIDELDSSLGSLVEFLGQLENVPTKERKFIAFCMNGGRLRDQRKAKALFDFIMRIDDEAFEEEKQEKQEKKKKKKKKGRKEEEKVEEEPSAEEEKVEKKKKKKDKKDKKKKKRRKEEEEEEDA